MTLDRLAALILFAVVATGTPGPNNLMVMASGANFGLRRTVPHIVGIALGIAVMLLAVGGGLAGLFEALPWLAGLLAALSLAYLLILAWKIATAAPPDPSAPPGRPLTVLQAAAFQWVNPKAWAMALTTVSVYVPASAAPLAALVFAAVCLPIVALWCAAGRALGRMLRKPARLRAFNVTMAALLVLSPVLVFL